MVLWSENTYFFSCRIRFRVCIQPERFSHLLSMVVFLDISLAGTSTQLGRGGCGSFLHHTAAIIVVVFLDISLAGTSTVQLERGGCGSFLYLTAAIIVVVSLDNSLAGTSKQLGRGGCGSFLHLKGCWGGGGAAILCFNRFMTGKPHTV